MKTSLSVQLFTFIHVTSERIVKNKNQMNSLEDNHLMDFLLNLYTNLL